MAVIKSSFCSIFHLERHWLALQKKIYFRFIIFGKTCITFNLTKFVRLKLSQNSSNFSKPTQSVLFRSTLKSPITIRLSYLLTALLRQFVTSSKNISRLVEVGGLQTLRQNHFFLDMVDAEAMVSLTFVSYSLIFLVMIPFLTTSISLSPFLSLSLRFLISKFSM